MDYGFTIRVRDSQGGTVAQRGVLTVAAPSEQFDKVLTGDIAGDNLVPAGQKHLVGAARLRGNLRTTGGTIAFRPGSSA